MTATELTGPVPKPRRAISGKFMWIAGGGAIVAVLAVIWGFHVRIEQKNARKESQHTATVASDAAAPPQQMPGSLPAGSMAVVPMPAGAVPMGSVYAQPNTAAPLPGVAPLTSAVATVAHPFPTQPATQGQPYYVAAAPVADPQTDFRAKAIERSLTRAQQAMEAPTSATVQPTASSAPVDPMAAEIQRMNALLATPPSGSPVPTSASRPPLAGALEVPRDPNAQGDKDQFGRTGEGQPTGYLKAMRTPPLSRFVIQRGTRIPAALPQRVVSDLPGDIVAEVQRDVYDSPTQTFVLIPAGSRLVGAYNSHVSYGQGRVQVIWTAVYFPDGSFIDLDKMPGQAADGGAGLKDQVDNHWGRLIGGVALSSVLAAGLAVSQNRSSSGSVLQYPSAGQQAASAVGTQSVELGSQITNRNLNVQPTLKIRPGELFGVFVTRDILFAGPYEALR